MQLLLLHLDDALELQTGFMHSCLMAGAQVLDQRETGRTLRLWAKDAALHGLGRAIAGLRGQRGNPRLSFMGSGDFHHVSALLLQEALAHEPGPVTVLHLDNHPDWVHFAGGMHCGSWVNRALSLPQVERVITVGVCSSDLVTPERKGANLDPLMSGRVELYPYSHPPSRVRRAEGQGPSFDLREGALHWRSIAGMGEGNFLDLLPARIGTEAVYITLDKDVLRHTDAATNWDQGQMSLAYAMELICEIGRHHRIIGADVTGDWSRPAYSGGLWTRAMKVGEILIDQPWQHPDPRETIEMNGAANLALLDVFEKVMP